MGRTLGWEAPTEFGCSCIRTRVFPGVSNKQRKRKRKIEYSSRFCSLLGCPFVFLTDQPAISASIICPISPTKTILYYQIFTLKSLSPAAKQEFYDSLRALLEEDKEMATGAQKNYEKGVWGCGMLHPNKENGVAWFQGKLRKQLSG